MKGFLPRSPNTSPLIPIPKKLGEKEDVFTIFLC